MDCAITTCKRKGKYFMCWVNAEGDKVCGMVCAVHDRYFGRKNLIEAGMTKQEAIAFEKDTDNQ